MGLNNVGRQDAVEIQTAACCNVLVFVKLVRENTANIGPCASGQCERRNKPLHLSHTGSRVTSFIWIRCKACNQDRNAAAGANSIMTTPPETNVASDDLERVCPIFL